MKAALPVLALLLASPALAQGDGLPLLRVYIDTPYFYELVAYNVEESGDHQRFDLVVEGKEVGTAAIDLDCASGEFSQTETEPLTGSAASFIEPAVRAYRQLLC
ncbi:hypothetical protein DEVEQU_03453 [Devosia equisanguinis]|uniref:Uncharacterized protein n=1 Tax=Devosia equisanguinis TaxID=2490941 RepID=A0A447IFP0_9HYPH|nr:hypothetical protein [Devosia equisanguinis]VDS06295.1 hypothetical protein DEVEQU_03453 [Devosia equisanguinis]